MVSVCRGSACGEDSVRPDEGEAAADIATDDVDEFGVLGDVGGLERGAGAGPGYDQCVASAAEQGMQPGRSKFAADRDVGEPVAGLRPRAVTVGLDERAARVGDRKLGQLAGPPALDRWH